MVDAASTTVRVPGSHQRARPATVAASRLHGHALTDDWPSVDTVLDRRWRPVQNS